MRVLLSLFCGFLLTVALVPLTLLAVMTLGFHASFWMIGQIVQSDSSLVHHGGTRWSKESEQAFGDTLANAFLPYAWQSLVILALSLVLLGVYIALVVGAMRRWRRRAVVLGVFAALANGIFLALIAGPYATTAITLNHVQIFPAWVYPTFSICTAGALAWFGSWYRFPGEPPRLKEPACSKSRIQPA